MPRVKRGSIRTRKRRRLLAQTKGYHWGRRKKVKLAKTAIRKASADAFRGRREKKRLNRGLWQIQINAGARQQGVSYSRLIDRLKKKGISLDRKMLATLSREHPDIFEALIAKIK